MSPSLLICKCSLYGALISGIDVLKDQMRSTNTNMRTFNPYLTGGGLFRAPSLFSSISSKEIEISALNFSTFWYINFTHPD